MDRVGNNRDGADVANDARASKLMPAADGTQRYAGTTALWALRFAPTYIKTSWQQREQH